MTRITGKAGAAKALTVAGVVLVAGCGATGGGGTETADPKLVALRAAAAMRPCPAGLGPALPDLTLPCLSGGPDVRLRAPGPSRPVLVNVWATWCGPCVREVPELVDLARDGAGKLDVVGVLTQDTPGNGLEFARQFAMRYPSVLDDSNVVLKTFSPGPPATLFLDATGALRFVQRGEIKDTATLRALVREHLGVDVADLPDPATAPGGPSNAPGAS